MKARTGKSFNDRERSANIRNMGLDLLEKILSPNYKDKKYQKEVMLRMAPVLLPRLTEVTGEDGKPLVIEISGSLAKRYGANPIPGKNN